MAQSASPYCKAPGIDLDEPFYGVCHFGIWVDDPEATIGPLEKAGDRCFEGNVSDNPNTYFEVAAKVPDDMVIHLTHSGWPGR